MGRVYVTALFALCHAFAVNSWPTGAPADRCVNMLPNHGEVPQNTATPYSISVSPANFTKAPGTTQTLTVTITGNTGADIIKGFLVQARKAFGGSTDTVGAFAVPLPTSTKFVACNSNANGAVTHSARLSSTTLTLQWTFSQQEHIEFWITIVQAKATFWIQQKSDIVYYPDVPIPAPATTMAPTTQASISRFTTTDCGKSKGCYRLTNCQAEDCTFFVSWKPNADKSLIDFEVSGQTGDISGSDSWVSVGFSSDSKMGGTSVVDCISEGGIVKVKESKNDPNPAKNNVALNPTVSVSNTEGSLENGLLRCKFTRKTDVTNNAVRDLAGSAYILLARGPALLGTKSKHTKPTASSPEALKVTDVTLNIIGKGGFPLVKAHGILMIIAWLFTATTGVFMARYFKPHWPESKLCGEKVWFSLHRFNMITTFLLTCTAFIIIFVEVGGYSSVTSPTYEAAHPIIGIIVTALCVINPIMAIFRPHPGEDKRIYFNWAHYLVGMGAQLLGIVNVALGVSMAKSDVPDWTKWIVVAFAGVFVIVHIILEILNRLMLNETAKNSFEMQQTNSESNLVRKPEPYGYVFRLFVYLMHVCIALIVVVVVSIVVGLGSVNFA